MSLADVIAASQAARSVVLLGDPQQLDQPQQGSHPEGADVSALEHMLGDHKTIPSDRGIFLRRRGGLHRASAGSRQRCFTRDVCLHTSGLERQVLVGTAPFEGAGLWVDAVRHDGNQSSSIEEADEVDRIVVQPFQPGAQWIDSKGVRDR